MRILWNPRNTTWEDTVVLCTCLWLQCNSWTQSSGGNLQIILKEEGFFYFKFVRSKKKIKPILLFLVWSRFLPTDPPDANASSAADKPIDRSHQQTDRLKKIQIQSKLTADDRGGARQHRRSDEEKQDAVTEEGDRNVNLAHYSLRRSLLSTPQPHRHRDRKSGFLLRFAFSVCGQGDRLKETKTRLAPLETDTNQNKFILLLY